MLGTFGRELKAVLEKPTQMLTELLEGITAHQRRTNELLDKLVEQNAHVIASVMVANPKPVRKPRTAEKLGLEGDE